MFYRLGDRGGDNQGNNSVTIYSTLFKLITERRSPTPHLSFPNMRYSANWSKRKKKKPGKGIIPAGNKVHIEDQY